MHIRSAAVDDADEILAIYAPYIEDTAITFEYVVPSLDEFRGRITGTLERYPYLVAVTDEADGEQSQSGKIVGYAYASAFKEREAYDWAIETSIYVARDRRRGGVGSKLHAALKDALEGMGIQNMCACIAALPEGVTEDPYLTDASIGFHRHLGYDMVGRFHACAYKFDRWYDMVWMELAIGNHPVPAPQLKWDSAQQ